ncbi:MAG: hypothetical protein RIC06_13420 [Cyclobacteriaceae bacterium]
MRIEIKPAFKRDYKNIRNKGLIRVLFDKIEQLEKAKTTDQITGME